MTNLPSLNNRERSFLKAHLRKAPGFAERCAEQGIAPDLKRALVSQIAVLCQVLNVDAAAVVAQLPPPAIDEADEGEDMTPDESPKAPATVAPAPGLEAFLGDFDAVLHPTLSAKLRSGVSSLIQAAKAEALASVPEIAPVTVHTAPHANRAGMSTLGKVFGVKGQWSPVPVQMWSPCIDTPPVDHGYVFDAETVGLVVSAGDRPHPDYSWLHGAKGAGKTELVRQYAARTGRPFVRIGFTADSEKGPIIGQYMPQGGDKPFGWQDGVFTDAIRKPGCVILLDEPSIADPGILAVFQTCLDLRCFVVEEDGSTIPFADGVVVIAADNTAGFGDNTGNYSGTREMNHAFLDRFARKVLVSLPDKATLAKIISTRTNVPNEVSLMLADLILISHKGEKANGGSLSLRPVMAFARDLKAGLPAKACLEATIFSSLPNGAQEKVRQQLLAQFDMAKAVALATGKAPMSPAHEAAVSDFT